MGTKVCFQAQKHEKSFMLLSKKIPMKTCCQACHGDIKMDDRSLSYLYTASSDGTSISPSIGQSIWNFNLMLGVLYHWVQWSLNLYN